MTTIQALAICSALAYVTLGVTHLFVWHALRERCWAYFSATCLLAGAFYLIESTLPVVGGRPNPAVVAVGHFMFAIALLGVGHYFSLAGHVMTRLTLAMAVQSVLVVGLAAVGALPRIWAFVSYGGLCLMLLTALVLSVDRDQLRAKAAVLFSLLLHPILVAFTAAGLINMAYIRYVTGLPMLMVGVVMLDEGLLRSQQQAKSTMQDLVDAQAKLHEVIAAMADGSAKVAATGNAVSENAQLLAIRTDEQTARLKETASSVQEVVNQVQHTAEHVAAVDGECANLSAQTRQGESVVNAAVQSIELIEKRSHEMSEAINLIEAIAFQTTILALNAAIEAARAGAAGRGFAVVAAEVRALSNSTTQSANNVKQLIERANAQSIDGVQKVLSVKKMLDQMSLAIDGVATRTHALSADAEQQTISLEQIMNGLDSLTQLTDANATMVAESVIAAD